MAIIISKNGENALKLDKSAFEDEKYLQTFICNNPDSVPLSEIKADIKLLILAREFPTSAGPIDALGVDKEGEIYIVETKLYKNPDKRAVVAQVLDYGASLWKYGEGFDDFISRIEDKLNSGQRAGLNEKLAEFYGLDEDEIESFRRSMRRNLSEGSFRFIVLMDALHQGLKDLVVFINQHSRFSLFAVEVEYYKHQGLEIVIPKLFGAERHKPDGDTSRGTGKLTPQELFTALRVNTRPEIATLVEQTLQDAASRGLLVKFGTAGVSLKCADAASGKSFVLGRVGPDGKLTMTGSFSSKCNELKIPRAIWEGYYQALHKIVPEAKVEPWPGRKDLLWLSDGDNDWPNAEPFLQKRDEWFKVINDTMAQIRPLLTPES